MAAETATKPTQTVEPPQPAPAAVPAVAQAKAPLAVGARVSAIVPTDIEQIFRLAGAIAAAEWAPKSYLINPRNPAEGYDKNKIMVGIMQGMEVGLTPMAALQSIAVINGMPSLWGDGALAVVRASGLMVDIKEDVGFDDKGAPEYAVCTVWRVGQATPIERAFTRAQAQKAGLWTKQGPWTQYPQRMLQMRARAWALRDGFADVMRGMAVGEEARDIPRDITPREPQRSDYVPPASGGYDPEAANDGAAAATATKPAVTDAAHEPAEPGVWPIWDHFGEQTGEYGFTEWLDKFDEAFKAARNKTERGQVIENNTDAARQIVADADCPEQLRAAIVERIADAGPAQAA